PPGHSLAVPAQPPDAPRLVIAVDVDADQLLQATPAIDISPRDRGRLRVRMLDHRRQDRRRAAFRVSEDRLMPLDDAPAVVAAALDSVNHLPQFPADVADP